MKTRAKRLAAILMAAVMTAAMAVPAFAASDTTDSEAATETGSTTGIAISSMDFTKVVDADANTYQPEETFKFTVAGATAGENEKYNGAVVSTGTGSITAADVTTDPTLMGKQTYKSSLDFSSLSFDQPGVYKYTVTETKGTNKDMTYDKKRTLYVYVRWNSAGDATEIYGAAMTEDESTTKSANFTNVYKTSGDTTDEFKDLTVKKKVTGAQGDTSKLFNFQLTITSGSGRKYYKVSTTANGSAEQLESGKTYDFQLKNGDKIVVENLSTNDTYMVIETESGKDGYTTTGEVNQAKAMVNKDTTETITNNKDAVTPTGIVMSYGPYMLMIAAAAVLAFVFLRKREEI